MYACPTEAMLIAMFLSPDNYAQNPNLTQNFNTYGYCLNNPLKYTDPSGMLMSGPDDLDQYFGHMTDVTGAWHMSGGATLYTHLSNYIGI